MVFCALLERLCNLMPSLVLLSDYDPSHLHLSLLLAGLAAYASWVSTLQLLSHAGSPPAVFTDFCEEAAVQGMHVMQAVVGKSMHWMPVSINPFRKPLSCQGRDNNLPSFSNAFMFGMAPQS